MILKVFAGVNCLMDPRLLEAARKGDIIELETLLVEDPLMIERGSLATSPDTVLHIAAMTGQTNFVRKVLELKPDFATRLNKDGFSAIHIASANGFVETVRELLKVNPEELGHLKSSDGKTALHCAAITGRVQVLRELVSTYPECKDDVTIRGETALHLALKNNQFEAFKAMVDMFKHLNVKDLFNAGDSDGNTVLHIATARNQYLIVKLLLGGDDIAQETMEVNLINKSGLTALDLLDIVQQIVGEPSDSRELLLLAKARRASEIEEVVSTQVQGASTIGNIVVQTQVEGRCSQTIEPPHNFWVFLSKELSFLNPWIYWKMLAKQVRRSPTEMQNALMVVAALITTVTYQAILNPPGGFHNEVDDHGAITTYYAIMAINVREFILFMVPNSIAYFASLAVIALVIHEFPLKSLVGVAARSMVASYVCGLFFIGPTSVAASNMGATVVGTIVLVDLVRFSIRLCKRWSIYREAWSLGNRTLSRA